MAGFVGASERASEGMGALAMVVDIGTGQNRLNLRLPEGDFGTERIFLVQ